jgi:hypothetical protein
LRGKRNQPAWGCICVQSRAPTGKRQKRLIRWARMYLKRKANTIWSIATLGMPSVTKIPRLREGSKLSVDFCSSTLPCPPWPRFQEYVRDQSYLLPFLALLRRKSLSSHSLAFSSNDISCSKRRPWFFRKYFLLSFFWAFLFHLLISIIALKPRRRMPWPRIMPPQFAYTRWYPARCYGNFYKIWRCNLKVGTLKWFHRNIFCNNNTEENTFILLRGNYLEICIMVLANANPKHSRREQYNT